MRRHKGDGALYQTRINGDVLVWCADWKDANGKRHRKFGASPEQALQRKAKAVQTMQTKTVKKPARKQHSITVSELMAKWLNVATVSDETRTKYRNNLTNHVIPVIGNKTVKNLTTQELAELFIIIDQKAGTSAGDHVRTITNTLLNYALKTNIIKTNPMAPIQKKQHKNSREIYIDEHIDDHLYTAVGIYEWIKEKDNQYHQYLPLITCMMMGLRRAEALGLTTDSVDMENRELIIRTRLMQVVGGGYYLKYGTKNGSIKKIPLNTEYMNTFKEQKKRIESIETEPLPIKNTDEQIGTGKILITRKDGTHLSYNDWNVIWREIQDAYATFINEGKKTKVSIKDGTYIYPHEMRHIFASRLAYTGTVTIETAEKLMGHFTEAMTEHYTHITDEAARKAMTDANENTPLNDFMRKVNESHRIR